MDDSIYYSYDKLLSYNALLNLVIGERGVGKTYGAKKYVIKRYKKHHKQFAYLRLKQGKSTYPNLKRKDMGILSNDMQYVGN